MERLYNHSELIHNFSAAREVLPFLATIIQFNSVVDFGCGLGTWLAVAKEIGVEKIVGVDGSYIDFTLLKIPRETFVEYDLRKEISLKEKFDLAICLEVAEHLPEDSADLLLKNISRHSDIVLFSAAIPGQGGQKHINEQWSEYWEEKFSSYGYLPYDILRREFWNNSKVEWWYRQNMVIYAKPGILPFHPSSAINLIHPELLLKKEQTIRSLRQELRNWKSSPGIIRAAKLLFKAILKALSLKK